MPENGSPLEKLQEMIHWGAPQSLLEEHEVKLGNYPAPCVDHSEARARALEALASLKTS